MRGKAGLVVGLAVGYVLGTRAGRERYEQIKTQWLKVWHTDPVQKQVEKVTTFAKEAAMALPSTLWNSAVKVTKAASSEGTPREKADKAVAAGKESAEDVAKTVKASAKTAKKAADDAVDETSGRGGA
ncbi:hypothetical protein ACFC3F_03825 [Microbacterium sp. NPDC055910]|uniref:hypothetical protein n=1 Tax=Microbacterium sp. NPDC055910 TaxID=3345659 RepID=UPI0035E00EF8